MTHFPVGLVDTYACVIAELHSSIYFMPSLNREPQERSTLVCQQCSHVQIWPEMVKQSRQAKKDLELAISSVPMCRPGRRRGRGLDKPGRLWNLKHG